MIKKNKTGFTLIELIISLGILIILTALVFIAYSKVTESYKSMVVTKETRSIVTQLKALYSKPEIYSGEQRVNFTTHDYIETTLPPNEMWAGDTLLYTDYSNRKTPFGGLLNIDSGGGKGAFDNITILYPVLYFQNNNFPVSTCIQLVDLVVSLDPDKTGSVYIYGSILSDLTDKKEITKLCSQKQEDSQLSFNLS